MLTRRLVLASGAAFGLASALPALAQRANPMPEALRQALERDPNAPVLGNPQGDVTLVEFFDYNCPFCRKMVPTMQRLIASDPGLRVVFREWPVFGPGSEFAARAALASMEQGKYWQMHAGLMDMKGRAEEATVLRVARRIGLDTDRLRADMDRPRVRDHVKRSMELADHMALTGTPTIIAGDEAVFGQISLDELKAMVARARRALG